MLKFGFVGLNDITEAMCINLLKLPSSMAFVNDVSIARVEYVSEHGAVGCEMAADVIDRADIIVMMHKNFPELQATMYSIMGNLTSQKIILDLSEISPRQSLDIASMLKTTGALYADITTLSTFEEIEQKKGTLLYGGPSNLFLKIQEYLKTMCGSVIKTGEVSSALAMKVCNSILYAQIQNGVNEMLLYASKNGLYIDDIVTALNNSPASNAFLAENGKKIADGNFQVKTKIKSVHKQLEFAHEYTFDNKVPMKGLEHTKSLYDSALDRKIASHDVTELYTIVERASHS